MAEAASDVETLPQWGGTYVMDRAARECVGGYDTTQALVEGKIRNAAREAGHEPVGRVEMRWYDQDPDAEVRLVAVDGAEPEPDPDKVWARAVVRVRPHARVP